MLFQGKLLSLKNVNPNYKVGLKEGTQEKKKLNPELNDSTGVRPVREAGTVDHSGTSSGL